MIFRSIFWFFCLTNICFSGGKKMPSADQTLDCKGLNCPLPVLQTKKAMDALNPGQVLEMLSTDPGSKNDITAWAKRTGNELVETVEDSGVFKFYLKKN
jgi:tRNA 2-thiouridine synthesizing protein A